MEVTFDRGVYLPGLDLWLDSRRRRESGVISHGHTDHTARHSRPILTHNTGLLLSGYLKKSSVVLLDFHEPFEADNYTLTLYPAGHCLGSAQVLVQSKATGERLLYTGDFKTSPSPTNEPLEPVPCDILVMESTYGRPQYTFPSQEQVMSTAYQVLQTWLSRGEKPVVQGWRLGKAQEILYLLLGQGFEVALEESVYRVASIYREGGVTFPGQLRAFDGRWAEGQVLLCPPGKWARGNLDGVRGLRFMELTGWAALSPGDGDHRWGRRGDCSLPYSDHADFNSLVDYVSQVQPKEVYTVNGFPELAEHLRGLGYPAVHLGEGSQSASQGFQMKLV